MTSREHHALGIQLDGRTSFLIWVGGEVEDRVLSQGDTALAFGERAAVQRYADDHHLTLSSTLSEVVDLDEVAAWLGGDEPLEPVLLLNAWNLFWDIANGTGRSIAHRSPDLDHIYNKLFAANNLPAVTPPGETYVPEWTDDESLKLTEVVRQGLALVRSAVRA
ncbi:MAG: hypothetical protein M3256_08400 [Actinomycetota bacterium]|nr:hypothetical protein [Actinomycetota bacterium]